jgi:hypothetical protein
MKKKITYGPRDVNDVSWALFWFISCLIMRRPNKCIIADTKHSYIIYLQVLQQT